MLNTKQLIKYVIEPTLNELELYSEAAVDLLIGTAVQESNLQFIHQISGPAISIYQIEPETYNDMWVNYINYRSELSNSLRQIAGYKYHTTGIDPYEMHGNLFYATAMCRIHYLRVPAPLPEAYDVEGMAAYWKKYYNTPIGKGTEEQYIDNYVNKVLDQ